MFTAGLLEFWFPPVSTLVTVLRDPQQVPSGLLNLAPLLPIACHPSWKIPMDSLAQLIHWLTTLGSIGSLVSGWKLLQTVRASRYTMAERKLKRLLQLSRNGQWRTASPIELQQAASDAVGVELDDRHVRLTFERHRPLAFLRDLRRCMGMIQLTVDGKHFESRGLKFRASYRRHAVVTWMLGFVPYILFMMVAGTWPGLFSKTVLVTIFTGMLVWVPFTIYMASSFEAARRLVELLDEVYPAYSDAHGQVPVVDTLQIGEVRPGQPPLESLNSAA